MNINELELFLVEIGLNDRDQPVRSLLARLVTDSGLEGWGESTIAWPPAELAGRRDALLPLLAGRSIFDLEELGTLDILSSDAPLRCAVEMAFWDLIGRAVEQPICNLFGGTYRRRVPLAVRLAPGEPSRIAQVGRELAEQGYHVQIITSSGRPEDDLRTLIAVREIAGERTELRFDAAASYDAETAFELCRELETAGLQLFLDPINTRDLHEVAALRRQTSVPLAVARTIASPADILAAVRCGAAPFVVVDLPRVGGMTAARQCATVASAGCLGALLGGEPSLGIATAAVMQLAAATAAFSGSNESAYHRLHDDVLATPLEIVDGMMAVPQGPGLGIDVDRAKVERYQVS